LLLCATPVMAQRVPSPARKSLPEFADDVARAMQDYRDAVARSVPLHEAHVQEAFDVLEERRRLHDAGLLAAAYVEQAERDLKTAQGDPRKRGRPLRRPTGSSSKPRSSVGSPGWRRSRAEATRTWRRWCDSTVPRSGR
jgi:hypothetical protein